MNRMIVTETDENTPLNDKDSSSSSTNKNESSSLTHI